MMAHEVEFRGAECKTVLQRRRESSSPIPTKGLALKDSLVVPPGLVEDICILAEKAGDLWLCLTYMTVFAYGPDRQAVICRRSRPTPETLGKVADCAWQDNERGGKRIQVS